jgi:integrase
MKLKIIIVHNRGLIIMNDNLKDKVDNYGDVQWEKKLNDILTKPGNEGLLFYMESLESIQTKRSYFGSLERFRKWGVTNNHGWYNYNKILEENNDKLLKKITMYVIYLKKTINPNTLRSYTACIKGFLDVNDMELRWKKIYRFFPKKIRRVGVRAYSTEDIQQMLVATTSLRIKALILFLSSTGCRVGSIPLLRIKHLRNVDYGCKLVTMYEDEVEEYKTCLTPEAVIMLERYHNQRKNNGEIFTDDTLLFTSETHGRNSIGGPIQTHTLQMMITRTLECAGLREDKNGVRYNVMLCHGFRKRFNTLLKLNTQFNNNIIEKLMGHQVSEEIGNSLDDSYMVVGKDPAYDGILVEEFQKGVYELTISDEERQRIRIKELEKENTDKIQNQIDSSLDKRFAARRTKRDNDTNDSDDDDLSSIFNQSD